MLGNGPVLRGGGGGGEREKERILKMTTILCIYKQVDITGLLLVKTVAYVS